MDDLSPEVKSMTPNSSANAPCTTASHDALRADPAKFRRLTRLTFSSWSVNEAGHDEEYQSGLCNACQSTISIPSRLLSRTSPHEHAARAVKVLKIVALVPPAATAAERDYLAAELERWDDDRRTRFAEAAGCRRPGSETWRMVVEAVRLRRTALEIEALTAGEAVIS